MPHVTRRIVVGLTAGALGMGLLAATTPPAQAAPPAPRPIVTGWIPYWDTSDGVASVVQNADLFADVSPFWYSARGNAPSITIGANISASTAASVTSTLRAAGVKVLPTITDGSGLHDMSAQLSTTSGRAAMVSRIVSLVTTNGYDGIDLDWENFTAWADGSATYSTTRPRWVAFVKSLYAALHTRGKLLAVTVPAGVSTSTDSTGYWAYAWSEIGPYVDRLRIMAYDYSVSSAGPIAPFSWVDKVVAKAVTQVSSRKIQIGVPSYGRDWRTATTGTCPNVALDPATSSSFFSNLSWAKNRHEYSARGAASYVSNLFDSQVASIAGIRRTVTPVSTWDDTAKERTFSYALAFDGRYQAPATTVSAAGGLAAGTTVIVSTTSGMAVGDTVVGTGVAAGAKVAAISGNVLTLSPANAGAVTGRLTVTDPSGTARSTVAVGGYLGGTTIRVLTSGGAKVGSLVTGAGVAPGARVTAVSSHVLTVSAVHTGSVTGAVTTTPPSVAATCTISRKGWYGEAGSAVAAASLVAKYKLAGIAQWTIGGEDTTQWAPLRSYATQIAQLPTAVSVSAPSAMYAGRRAVIGALVTSNGSPVVGAAVYFLYKPTTSSTWTRYGSGLTGADGRLVWTSPAMLTSGSWRAYVPDTWYRGSGNDVAAATTVRRAATVVSLAATPRVAAGGIARGTARVTSLGAPVVGAYVNFWWKPSNSSSWVVLGKAVTNASGVAVRSFAPRTSGYWRASVGSTTTRLSALTTATVATALVPRVSVAAARITVAKGSVAALRAVTFPAGAGQVGTVQRYSSSGWVNVGTAKSDSSGRLAWRLPTSSKGTWKYRWYVHATSTHASGFSVIVTVTVA